MRKRAPFEFTRRNAKLSENEMKNYKGTPHLFVFLQDWEEARKKKRIRRKRKKKKEGMVHSVFKLSHEFLSLKNGELDVYVAFR